MPTETIGICEPVRVDYPFGYGVAWGMAGQPIGSQILVPGHRPWRQSHSRSGLDSVLLVRMPAGQRRIPWGPGLVRALSSVSTAGPQPRRSTVISRVPAATGFGSRSGRRPQRSGPGRPSGQRMGLVPLIYCRAHRAQLSELYRSKSLACEARPSIVGPTQQSGRHRHDTSYQRRD
jgi:hypothetical protein